MFGLPAEYIVLFGGPAAIAARARTAIPSAGAIAPAGGAATIAAAATTAAATKPPGPELTPPGQTPPLETPDFWSPRGPLGPLGAPTVEGTN